MTSAERSELEKLLTEDSSAGRDGASMSAARSPVKAQIDSMVGAQCLYCGDVMITSISQPLIPPENMQKALLSWK
jgi:hypothetical protein